MLLVKYCAISCYCLPMWMALSKGEFQITAHTVLFISGIYTALSFSQGTEIPTHHLQLQVLFHSIPGIRYSKCCSGPPVLQDIAPGLRKKGIRFIHLYSYGGKRKKANGINICIADQGDRTGLFSTLDLQRFKPSPKEMVQKICGTVQH